MALETLQLCPLCNRTNFTPHLVCEDHLSSHQQFQLQKCTSCNFLITNPRPDAASLPSYYQSDQYISHSGKSSGAVQFLYLLARRITLRWKINLILRFKDTISLLDYGCGTGELLKTASQQGWQVAGLEPSLDARQKAESITGINIAANINELKGQQFDVITLWHVLEHISDLRATITELKTMLKDDGLLFIAVPNCESHDALFYQAFWAAYDVPRHLWHFTRHTMRALLHAEGMTLRAIHPMKLDAYYVSLLSEKYKGSTRLPLTTYCRAALRGFLSNRKAKAEMNYSSVIYIVSK